MSHPLADQTVIIAGGSGFIGVSLARYLTDQDVRVVVLTRNPDRHNWPWKQVCWDGRSLGEWVAELDGAAGLVNLAGRSVDCRKTPDHRDEILRSRVESTRVLGEAMRQLSSPPPVWVQMGTAHIYGDPPTALCDEDSAFGYGLAPDVGRAWEETFADSKLPDQRGVVLRTSFVVGKDQGAGGGALAKLGPLTRWGLGGRVGSGTQGMSWIHETDMNRLIERGLIEPEMQGAYISSSPNPKSQIEFMRCLRKAVGMPVGFPAFAWMVRFGARWILKTDPDLALYGRYVKSHRLEEEGFQFQYPDLDCALADVYSKK